MDGKFFFTEHALKEMLEDELDIDDVKHAAQQGETIETYPNDKPYPSELKLYFSGFWNNQPIHVVCATDDNNYIRIITTYKPDPAKWVDNFKTRKKKRT